MTDTATITANCRCEVPGCGVGLAEHEVLAHLTIHHPDRFGMKDWPARANVETEDGEPL